MERPDERQIAVSLRVVEPVAHHELVRDVEPDVTDGHVDLRRLALTQQRTHGQRSGITAGEVLQQPRQGQSGRSEEHTSELQSRENLVCRLLLEKKKSTTRKRSS